MDSAVRAAQGVALERAELTHGPGDSIVAEDSTAAARAGPAAVTADPAVERADLAEATHGLAEHGLAERAEHGLAEQ